MSEVMELPARGRRVCEQALDEFEPRSSRRARVVGEQALALGQHTVAFDLQYDGPGLGKGGTGTLMVDGRVLTRHLFEHTGPSAFGLASCGSPSTSIMLPFDDQKTLRPVGALGAPGVDTSAFTTKRHPARSMASAQRNASP